MFAALKKLFLTDFIGDPYLDRQIDEAHGLDTGFYVIGRLAARFLMEITRRDSEGRFVALKLATWRRLIGLLLAPLQEMGALDNAWAMEGEIYGPEDGDGNDTMHHGAGHQVLIGRWELYVGDYDD